MEVKRRYLIIIGILLFSVSLGQSQPMWSTYQYNNQRTGSCPYIGPETADTLWTYTAGANIKWSSPVIAEDGTIYFGCQDGYFYAVNPDGTLKWTFMTTGEIQSSPAIGADGTIYIGSDDANIYAIEDSITYGKLRWSHEMLYPEYPPRSPVMVGTDGTVYAVAGRLEALDINGNQKWNYNTGLAGWAQSGSAMSHDGSTIYNQHATASDYYLASLDTSGSINWERDIGGAPFDFSFSTPTVSSIDIIYFPEGFDGPLNAIRPNSTIWWTLGGLGDLRYTSAGIGVGDTIYMAGGYSGNLRAITQSGSVIWTFPITGDVLSSPIIDGNGTIYIGSINDTLYAINPDGSLKWKFNTGADIYSTPAMDTSGSLYLCSGNKLYVIGPGGIGIADNPVSQLIDNFSFSIYPNPFREITNLKFQIPSTKSQISLEIYDVSGRVVKEFNLQSDIYGLQSVKWSGTDQLDRPVPAGIYFVRLVVNPVGESGGSSQTQKVILLR